MTEESWKTTDRALTLANMHLLGALVVALRDSGVLKLEAGRRMFTDAIARCRNDDVNEKEVMAKLLETTMERVYPLLT